MKAKKLRKKKCKARSCGKWFQPVRPLQVVCDNYQCALEHGREKAAKKREREHRERKKDLKPISHWLKETQEVFNKYIRLRDRHEPCISCRRLDSPEWCAGHFRTRGAASHLRFNEDNVHKQCNNHCNHQLSGNIAQYRPNLIAKIGLERVEALENDNSTKTWTREELEEIRKVYRAKIRDIEKGLAA